VTLACSCMVHIINVWMMTLLIAAETLSHSKNFWQDLLVSRLQHVLAGSTSTACEAVCTKH